MTPDIQDPNKYPEEAIKLPCSHEESEYAYAYGPDGETETIVQCADCCIRL